MKTSSICEHGIMVSKLVHCRRCSAAQLEISLKVKPLEDEFWDNRGHKSLRELLVRAYHMGRKHGKDAPQQPRHDGEK